MRKFEKLEVVKKGPNKAGKFWREFIVDGQLASVAFSDQEYLGWVNFAHALRIPLELTDATTGVPDESVPK